MLINFLIFLRRILNKMVRTWQEVPKRAKNSITIQLNKLIKKWGVRETRLVALKIFQDIGEKIRLEDDIKTAESNLKKLKEKQ